MHESINLRVQLKKVYFTLETQKFLLPLLLQRVVHVVVSCSNDIFTLPSRMFAYWTHRCNRFPRSLQICIKILHSGVYENIVLLWPYIQESSSWLSCVDKFPIIFYNHAVSCAMQRQFPFSVTYMEQGCSKLLLVWNLSLPVWNAKGILKITFPLHKLKMKDSLAMRIHTLCYLFI